MNDAIESKSAKSRPHVNKVANRSITIEDSEKTRSITESSVVSSLSFCDQDLSDAIRNAVKGKLDPLKDRDKLKTISSAGKSIKFPVKVSYGNVMYRYTVHCILVVPLALSAFYSTVLFLPQLMYVLEECSQFGHIVSWSDDGLSFIIHDAEQFEQIVLPHIFKDAMFNSFLRKVSAHLTHCELYLGKLSRF